MSKNRARGRYEANLDGIPKALREVLTEARRQGATITTTGTNHVQVRVDGQPTMHFAGTPRSPDQEARRARSKLRRAGLDL